MSPTVDLGALKKAKARDYAIRFLFGGVVSAGAGLVTHAWGPVAGGVFLAFPALLPASLTLVKEHDGRALAVDDARGACAGSVGLAVFGLVVWLCARALPLFVFLLLGAFAWFATSAILWWLCLRGTERSEARRGRSPQPGRS